MTVTQCEILIDTACGKSQRVFLNNFKSLFYNLSDLQKEHILPLWRRSSARSPSHHALVSKYRPTGD